MGRYWQLCAEAKDDAALSCTWCAWDIVHRNRYWRGVAVGAAEQQTLVAPITGRIVWNFDQQLNGTANFLNLGRLNQDEIHVLGYGAHGRNTSPDPVTEFSGYVRSDLTNARLPLLILAQDSNAPAIPGPFPALDIPTKPEETYGIPGLADFDVVTHEQAMPTTGVDGMPLSRFLRDFGAFTVVLEYDGIKIEKKFPTQQVKTAIEKFEQGINADRSTVPRVTRRPNASPPRQPTLPFVLPPIDPKPSPSPSTGSPAK
jgi:hypothetical protein